MKTIRRGPGRTPSWWLRTTGPGSRVLDNSEEGDGNEQDILEHTFEQQYSKRHFVEHPRLEIMLNSICLQWCPNAVQTVISCYKAGFPSPYLHEILHVRRPSRIGVGRIGTFPPLLSNIFRSSRLNDITVHSHAETHDAVRRFYLGKFRRQVE